MWCMLTVLACHIVRRTKLSRMVKFESWNDCFGSLVMKLGFGRKFIWPPLIFSQVPPALVYAAVAGHAACGLWSFASSSSFVRWENCTDKKQEWGLTKDPKLRIKNIPLSILHGFQRNLNRRCTTTGPNRSKKKLAKGSVIRHERKT